jgi:putative SOS response-associated peptidase YedK
MCFTVNVNLVKEELEERYGINFPDKYRYEPSYYYHASGLPEIPAICSGNPGTVRLLKWGLIPPWVKTSDDAEEIRFKTFNARAESVDTKPSFSLSFRSKRCLIPVKGFYEWQHVGKIKIPWYIYHAEDDIFTIAGLYSEWTPPGETGLVSTFSIITTDANELMAEIHNSKKRMPVILSRNDEKKWIDLSLSAADATGMLKPCPSELLRAHTISPLVNSKTANRNTPEVIRPYIYNSEKENSLF